jgi:hypothetical protein
MTFHESRNQSESIARAVHNAPGRTPIACQNCANAKTGCDKRVPCSRCAEKGLPCAARYARRSMKAAARAAQASSAFEPQTFAGHGYHPLTFSSSQDGIDAAVSGQVSPTIRSPPKILNDYYMLEGHEDYTSHPGRIAATLQPVQTSIESLNDFVPISADFTFREPTYQDMLTWPEYPMDLDFNSGSNCVDLGGLDISIPVFHQASDASSNSDPHSALSRRSTHTRCTSIGDLDLPFKALEALCDAPEHQSLDEPKAFLATESAWPLARCTSVIFSGACPRTAILHLESLEKESRNESTWAPLESYLDTVTPDAAIWASIKPLTQRTRDTMLAITQAFFHKALEIHRGYLQNRSGSASAPLTVYNFLVLPPSKLLEFFLYSFVLSSSDYFSLFPMAALDSNELALRAQPSHLLLLLMVAQGAMTLPLNEARILAAGLTETCRISLFDLIEKNVELSADPLVLTCALLFTRLGAWSGDKWLMDIAMGQRGMYMSVRHSRNSPHIDRLIFNSLDCRCYVTRVCWSLVPIQKPCPMMQAVPSCNGEHGSNTRAIIGMYLCQTFTNLFQADDIADFCMTGSCSIKNSACSMTHLLCSPFRILAARYRTKRLCGRLQTQVSGWPQGKIFGRIMKPSKLAMIRPLMHAYLFASCSISYSGTGFGPNDLTYHRSIYAYYCTLCSLLCATYDSIYSVSTSMITAAPLPPATLRSFPSSLAWKKCRSV